MRTSTFNSARRRRLSASHKADAPWLKYAAGFAICAVFVAAGIIAFVWSGRTYARRPSFVQQALVTGFTAVSLPINTAPVKIPVSYHELLEMTPQQLGKVDIALMNLVCAQGLPGAEDIDIRAILTTLDRWTERVRFETDRHLYRATDPRWADHYRRSESYLRVEFLLQVLQEDCRVHYNMERVRNPDFRNSKDLFLHGMVGSGNGGTCVSMPVLYVAIGRRLGYPIHLVLAKRHVFCRWDDGRGERFNFDGSGHGIAVEEDDYYLTWPARISGDAVARGEYLKSLTPKEELALFLAARGHPLFDTERLQEARDAYAAACRLMPQSRDNKSFLDDVTARLSTRGVYMTRQSGFGVGPRP